MPDVKQQKEPKLRIRCLDFSMTSIHTLLLRHEEMEIFGPASIPRMITGFYHRSNLIIVFDFPICR